MGNIGFQNLDDARRVRNVFSQAEYTDLGISQFLGDTVPLAPDSCQLRHLMHATDGGSPLETLLRLFLLNVPTCLEMTRAAIGPMELQDWESGGLIRIERQSAIPLVRFLPLPNLLLACDIYRADQQSTNFVMGLSGTTLALSNATIRRKVESTLDLGSGCGFQSFLAARHSRTVCGVDRNPRAIRFAEFNARLNDVESVEFLQGDLFEPVANRKFDFIISNPPFVVSPDFQALFRDNDQVGDTFCRQIVRQSPAFLNEGGILQMNFHWVHKRGQRWQDRLAQWCEGSGCDTWVIREATRSPAEYTRFWNQDKVNHAEFGEIVDRWMAWYNSQQIEAISSGLITMRRSSRGSNWFCADDAPPQTFGPIGEGIWQILETLDWLHGQPSDKEFLSTRFKLAQDVQLTQRLTPANDDWNVAACQLDRTRGLGYSGGVDSETAHLLCRCDGNRTLSELLHELAIRRNTTVEKIAPAYLNVVRRLLKRGFLELSTTKTSPLPRPTMQRLSLDAPILTGGG